MLQIYHPYDVVQHTLDSFAFACDPIYSSPPIPSVMIRVEKRLNEVIFTSKYMWRKPELIELSRIWICFEGYVSNVDHFEYNIVSNPSCSVSSLFDMLVWIVR